MTKLAFSAAGALALAGLAAAHPQTDGPRYQAPRRIPVQPKNAGTYHLATGTWTRTAGVVAGFGLSDNIYSNTAPSGYYTTVIGPTGNGALGEVIDEGVIPGTTNPAVFTFGGATTDIYAVTEIQIAYCDMEPTAGSAGWTLDFYEDHAPCSFPTNPPVGTVIVAGFPSNGCWFATLDLTAATGTGEEFYLQADGGAANPGYDGDLARDSFGISWQYTGTGLADAGPFITGDPAATDTGWTAGLPNTGSNTYFGEAGLCPGVGSGYQNWDSYWLEDTFGSGGVGYSNCYFFGSYTNSSPSCGSSPSTPHGGFWMEINAEPGGVPKCITICTTGCTGAITSTGSPAVCVVDGDLVAANNNARLIAEGVPPNQFGLFATGREAVPAMTVNSGNGWICINPGTQGGLGRFMAANQIKNSGPLGRFTLDTTLGEWSLTSIPTSMGSYAAMVGITSHFQAWFREPTGTGWNFSGSTFVTWQ